MAKAMKARKAAEAAARARIAKVPPSETLIDRISEEDWNDPDVANWNCCAGAPQKEGGR